MRLALVGQLPFAADHLAERLSAFPWGLHRVPLLFCPANAFAQRRHRTIFGVVVALFQRRGDMGRGVAQLLRLGAVFGLAICVFCRLLGCRDCRFQDSRHNSARHDGVVQFGNSFSIFIVLQFLTQRLNGGALLRDGW